MHVGGDIVRTTGCISVDTGDACTCPKPEHYLNFPTTSLTDPDMFSRVDIRMRNSDITMHEPGRKVLTTMAWP